MNNEYIEIVCGMIDYSINGHNKLELMKRVRADKLSNEDIERIIGLFRLDTYALIMAMENGVHPITGCHWYLDRSNALKCLLERNYKAIKALENDKE